MRFTGVIFQLKTQWLILAAVWTVSIVVVNPVGEFTINDDWSFLRLAEILWSEGRIPATGWGTGGPSAVVHVLWGRLFGFFGGFSPTVMRLSVLTLGVLSSSVLLVLLHLAGASGWVALLGTLTLVFNPLFFSQCFTFMTDITFLCVMLSALLFLCLGLDRAGIFLIVIGMIFALLAVLTRQIGIVIPFGILATCLLHPKGKALGSCRMALLTVGVCILPWLAYESFLSAVGSTPVTEHEVFEHILAKPMSEGAFGYLVYLFDQFFLVTMGYCGFLVSPVLVLRYPEYWRQRSLRYLFVVLTGALVVLEAGIFTGLAHPPIFFYRNVIYDIGIGPLLLKDTYILGIRRTPAMPASLYYVIAWWAALAAVLLMWLGVSTLRRLLKFSSKTEMRPLGVLATLSLLMAFAYIGIILLTGFHDRYLIPVCALFIVWLVADTPDACAFRLEPRSLALALVPLLSCGMFSLAGVRDFFEMKRAQLRAQNYVVQELHVAPCNFDGGFEFNGYHCNRKDFEPREGLSWWWVDREDYLIALGTLRGYKAVKTFPFARWVGSDGSIYVLQPTEKTGRPPP